ncbi:hypothetical protein DLS08_26110, partial [Escherichia coli]|nr:hypothetical protein [Salmonella enterica subsp. enterica serovar Kentucky]ECA4448594.1 hypothetical protein [Salmonella enterica subsp. enterica serovar Kentucky]EFO4000019.1 hypothetical protein [Escherichia coli]
PPLLCILWRLGIRLPPLPFMPFWQVTVLTGGLWGISWGCAMWFIYWGRRKVNRLPPWDDV